MEMDAVKKQALETVDRQEELLCRVCDTIWDYAELSLEEKRSAAL